MALAAGDAWLGKAANLLLFGPPGAGKSHCAAAIGRALIENGYRVLFTRTTDIVQRLQAARQALQLEAAIAKLDRYDLLILDDLSYVHKDHAETSVLFELIGARYEHRSMLITANQPFADRNKVFPVRHHHRRHRSSGPSCDHLRDERRELSTPWCARSQGASRCRQAAAGNCASLIAAPSVNHSATINSDGPVAEVVEIRGGVISGLCNEPDSAVRRRWRLHHGAA